MFVVASEVDSQPLRGVRQPIIWQNVCPKLHENERNWMHASLAPHPHGSTNGDIAIVLLFKWQKYRLMFSQSIIETLQFLYFPVGLAAKQELTEGQQLSIKQRILIKLAGCVQKINNVRQYHFLSLDVELMICLSCNIMTVTIAFEDTRL